MAINSSYPIADPAIGDIIIGSKNLGENGIITKSFTIANILALGNGEQGPPGPTGPRGLVWRGTWSDDNEYDIGDAVEFSGSSYVCVVAITTTPNPNPSVDVAKWDLLAQEGTPGIPGGGLIWRGTWNSIIDYDPGDAVLYQGSSYICTSKTSLIPPTDNLTDWDLLAQRGLQGIVWRAAWSDDNEYDVGDAVSFGGSSYICVTAITTTGLPNPSIDTARWDLLAQKGTNGLQGLVWRGAWADDNEYDIGDAVEFGGSSYICVVTINTTPNPNPTNDPAKWDLLAQEGAEGLGYKLSSVTTQFVNQGLKNFTVNLPATQSAYKVGNRVRGIFDASNYIEGTLTSYSGNLFVLNIDYSVGTGTRSTWTFSIAGEQGPQLPQSAYTVKVNNTNATAVPVETNYRSSGQQPLTETITFSDSQNPTGTVNASYNWHRIGNLVTMTATIEYLTYNVTTGDYLLFAKPSDMPDPVIPTGITGSSRTLYTGIGSARSSDVAINQDADAYNISYLRAQSGQGIGFDFMIPYTVPVTGDLSVFRMTLQYFTA